MHSWETIDRFCQFHPRWFESAERYAPAPAYLAIYRSVAPLSWRLGREGAWYVATPPGRALPAQGWKLHVSARTAESERVLARILPVLIGQEARFKFLVDPRQTAWINSKLCPRASGGKFVAVYPASDEQFHRLGEALGEVLADFEGPYVLSDRRWPGSRSVFYRYGGFVAQPELRSDGLRNLMITAPDGTRVKDDRLPYWSPPAWVDEPFPEPAAALEALADGRFEVTSALAFSNRGGIYRATDHRTGRSVLLKEARPNIEIGRHGQEAISVLEREHRLLCRLADTGHFVRPVAFFREAEHAFLAEEYVPGGHLGRLTIARNPLYSGPPTREAVDDYLRTMRGLWAQVAQAIAAAHERGVILGDLSFTNIMVDRDRIRIVDLEGAVQEDLDPHLGLYTPGFATPGAERSGVADRAGDYHALGAIIFGSLMLANAFTGLDPSARRRFLDELTVDLALPADLTSLIERLMTPSSAGPTVAVPLPVEHARADRPPAGPGEAGPVQADLVRVEHVPVAEAIERLPGLTASPRLACPPAQSPPAALRKQVSETLDGVVSYLHAVADPGRDDRLYPADPLVFQTNPLSVAFGASGVLYALHRITGAVPGTAESWLLGRTASADALPPGLYLGQSGVAWALAELGHAGAARELLTAASGHPLLHESHDLIRGVTGYGMTCLKFWLRYGEERFLDEASAAGRHLVGSAVTDERGVRWQPGGGPARLGLGYGGAGPALFLLYLHLATGDPVPLEAGRRALDFELARGARLNGRFAGFPDYDSGPPESAPVLRCYWDAGTAGVGTALVRYLAATGDPALEPHLTDLVSDTARKYTVLPQLFHGLAGLGNFLLDAWEHTGDAGHLAEAWRTAEGVLLFAMERPEGIAFPGEQAVRESADLATGGAGVGLFLHRLLDAGSGARGNFNFVVDELLDVHRP